MPGQSSFHCDGGCFGIAHFTDHDDVWVLSEHGSQPRSKGHSGTDVNTALVDSREFVFNRVFDGNDIVVAGVDLVKDRVEGR